MYDGSGGGANNGTNGTSTNGGQGGGIIWLSVMNHLRINNTNIKADGAFGKSRMNDTYGAGGGSGGSIQILTKHLDGNGILSAKGGNGSLGGGGGSGGRIVMNYLGSYL